MKTPVGFLFIFWFAFGLSSCSVIMAMSGEEEPDFNLIQPGANRKEVESQLGEPVESKTLESGVRSTYIYETGDPPDGRRAMTHIFLNIYSFGLYEIVGTFAEIGVHAGVDNKISVTYGPDDKVKALSEPVKIQEAETSESITNDQKASNSDSEN